MEKIPTKERILYAALNLFSEKGYDGAGMDLIAENAGIKGPSLYRHYKGKEDIFNSLIDMVESYYKNGIESGCQSGKAPKTIEELIKSSMTRIEFTMHDATIQKIRKIMAMEQFRNVRIAKLTSQYYLENMQEIYTEIFEELMENGVLKPDDPEALSLEFVSPVSLLIHAYDRQPERETEIMEKIRKHFEHFAKVYEKELQF